MLTALRYGKPEQDDSDDDFFESYASGDMEDGSDVFEGLYEDESEPGEDNGYSEAKSLYDSHVGPNSFNPDLDPYDSVVVRTGPHFHVFEKHAKHFGNHSGYHYFHDNDFPSHAEHMELSGKSMAVVSPDGDDYKLDFDHIPESRHSQEKDPHAPSDHEEHLYHPIYNPNGLKRHSPVKIDNRSKLDKSIVERVGDHPDIFHEYKKNLIEHARQLNEPIDQHNSAIDYWLKEGKAAQSNRMKWRHIAEKSDADSIKGMDSRISEFEGMYPGFAQSLPGWKDDPHQAVLDMVVNGKKAPINPHDSEVMDAVDDQMNINPLMGAAYYDRPLQSDDEHGVNVEEADETFDDSKPFSKDGIAVKYAMPLGPTTNAIARANNGAKMWTVGSIKKVDGHLYVLKETTPGAPRWHLLKDRDVNQGYLFDPYAKVPEELDHGDDGPIKPGEMQFPQAIVKRPLSNVDHGKQMREFIERQRQKKLFDGPRDSEFTGPGPKVAGVDSRGQKIMHLPYDDDNAVDIAEESSAPAETHEDKLKRIVAQSVSEKKNIWDLAKAEGITSLDDKRKLLTMRDKAVDEIPPPPINPARARAQELFKQKRAEEEQAAVDVAEPSSQPDDQPVPQSQESDSVDVVEDQPKAVDNFDELINDPAVVRNLRAQAIKSGIGKRNKEDIDDFIQDTMLAAHKARHRFDPDIAQFSTWIGKIGRNVAINNYRHKTRQKRDERNTVSLNQPAPGGSESRDMIADVEDHRSPEVSSEEPEFPSELRNSVRTFINDLPEKNRDIMIRVFVNGEKQADIAREKGLTRNAISVAVKRGIEKLRPMVETRQRHVKMVMEKLRSRGDSQSEKPINEESQPQETSQMKDLFGEPIKPAKRKPATNQPKETQGALFSTSGLPGQTQFIDEPGVPDDLVRKPKLDHSVDVSEDQK